MICRILKSKISALSSLNYNEDKLDLENAEVIGLNKIYENSAKEIYRVFNEYETHIGINPATKNKGFHMTLSPALYEKLTNEEVNSLTKELMESLGMNDQPWVVYRHMDTGIEHYHIVSTLIRSDGSKIIHSFEHNIIKMKMKELESKYPYKYGLDETKAKKNDFLRIKKFDSKKEDKAKQFRQLYMDALAYDCRDFEQFKAVMRTMNVKVTVSRHDPRLVFQGLYEDERECTAPQGTIDYDKSMYEGMLKGLDYSRKRIPDYREKQNRLMEKISTAFGLSESRQDFTGYLRQFNISVVFGKRHRDGTYEDITYVNHGDKTVMSHTEFKEYFTLDTMNERLRRGQWEERKKTAIERTPGQRPETGKKNERKIHH